MAAAENAVSIPAVKSMDEKYPGRFLASVHDFWKRESLVDVFLEVEGRTFACHRLVLAASSPYFADILLQQRYLHAKHHGNPSIPPQGMFTGGFSEAKQQKVSLQELDANCVEEILNYAYGGSVQVSSTNARELYLASDLLQVEHVRDTCLQFMVDHVEGSACVEYYPFAQAYGLTELLTASKAFICRKFSQLSQTEVFMELPLPVLKNILSSDDLDIQSELLVLQTVERWIKYNPEERMCHLEEAASVVRFNLISPDRVPKLFSHLEAVEQVRENGLCKNGSTQGRVGMDAKELLVFIGAPNPYCTPPRRKALHGAAAYDPETETMYQLADSLSYSLYPSVIVVSKENILYQLHFYRQFVMYDAVSNLWIKKASPLFEHEESSDLTYVGNKVYLFGDLRGSANHQNVECFDPACNQWTAVTPFPGKLGYPFFTASIGQDIYVVSLKYLYRYNATTDIWYQLSKLTTRLDINDVCAHAGKLYCINESKTRMFMYNPEMDSWYKEDVLDLPEARYSQLVSYQGRLRAVLIPKHADRRRDRIQIHTLLNRPGQAEHWDHHVHSLPPVCFDHQRFLCLNVRLFPSRLYLGHLLLKTGDDDDNFDDCDTFSSDQETSESEPDSDPYEYWDNEANF